MKLLKNFLKNWEHHTVSQMATLSVLIGSFVVLGLAAMIEQNLRAYLNYWGNEIKISVYLEDQIQEQDQSKIAQLIKSNPIFSDVKYLNKDAAYETFKDRVAKYAPNLVGDLQFQNPLPASFEIKATQSSAGSIPFDAILKFVKKMRGQRGVEDVSYGQGWIENYAALFKVFSASSMMLLVVLIVGILFVIGNSIHNSIAQKRDEIEVRELFGATRASIVIPYVWEGALMGLLSSAIAVLTLSILYRWQIDFIVKEVTFWNLQGRIEFLSSGRIAILIFMGSLLGALGSFVWARRVSTGWAASTAQSS